jgi:hypothetical protein
MYLCVRLSFALMPLRACRYDAGSTPEAKSPELAAFEAALRAEKLCKFPVRLLAGGAAAFEARYPGLVTGTPEFTDAELPSEVMLLVCFFPRQHN